MPRSGKLTDWDVIAAAAVLTAMLAIACIGL